MVSPFDRFRASQHEHPFGARGQPAFLDLSAAASDHPAPINQDEE